MFNNGFHHIVFINWYVVFDGFAKQLLKHWSILKKKTNKQVSYLKTLVYLQELYSKILPYPYTVAI